MKYKNILFCRKYLGAGEVLLSGARRGKKFIRGMSDRHRSAGGQTDEREKHGPG